jgi:outer membrane protein assembly factor BamB
MTGSDGRSGVIPKKLRLGERVAANTAIADDTFYLRTAGHLYAFGAKK